jgi:hypothetical protein
MVLRSPQHGSRMWSEEGYLIVKSYHNGQPHSDVLKWYCSSEVYGQTCSWHSGWRVSEISLED